MTSPVGQQAVDEGWAVNFMMPSEYTLDTVPRPLDRSVVVREIPEHTVAAIRYSGFWSEKNYSEHLQKLTAWIERQGLRAADRPVWARYDPPFKPWFMRRNEILITVQPASD